MRFWIVAAGALTAALTGCATKPAIVEPMAVLTSFWQPDGPECDFNDPLRMSAGFSTSAFVSAPRRASVNTYGATQVIPLPRRDQHLCIVLIRWRSASDETALAMIGFDVRPVDAASVRVTPAHLTLTESALTMRRGGQSLTTLVRVTKDEQVGEIITTLHDTPITTGRPIDGQAEVIAWDQDAPYVRMSVMASEWRPGRRLGERDVARLHSRALTTLEAPSSPSPEHPWSPVRGAARP